MNHQGLGNAVLRHSGRGMTPLEGALTRHTHITETARERHARTPVREREKHFCTFEAQLHFFSSTDVPFPSAFTFSVCAAFVICPRRWPEHINTRV